MKQYDKILMKLNDLFLMNHQVEETFAKVQCDVVEDDGLKSFLKEKEVERNEFGELLQNELKKLETKVEDPIMMTKRNQLAKLNFKKIFHFDNELDLFKHIYKVMQVSIEKYNELLMELHLPLSLCKLLIRQRDRIQSSLVLIKREVGIVDLA